MKQTKTKKEIKPLTQIEISKKVVRCLSGIKTVDKKIRILETNYLTLKPLDNYFYNTMEKLIERKNKLLVKIENLKTLKLITPINY